MCCYSDLEGFVAACSEQRLEWQHSDGFFRNRCCCRRNHVWERDLIDELFEAWIPMQRIEEGVILNGRYVYELLLPVALLKPIKRFISVTQAEIDHRASKGPNVRAIKLFG